MPFIGAAYKSMVSSNERGPLYIPRLNGEQQDRVATFRITRTLVRLCSD